MGVRWLSTSLLLLTLLAVSCDGDDGAAPSVASPNSEAPATIAPATTLPATTLPAPSPTTTIHQTPALCDDELEVVLASIDEWSQAARLDPGGTWSEPAPGFAFDDRTHTAEEFRYRMGLDCMARLSQTTSSGDQRLLLAAWTGERVAWVLQATDVPSEPFRADQLVQLFLEQSRGEWLDDQSVWAGSLTSGDTMIVGALDTAFGVAAKSWWVEIPRFDDVEVTNAAERYAIDALVQAGARNVSVGESADFQSEIAAVQFITPLGLHLIATVAPPEWFDPSAAIVQGEMVIEEIDGVEVYVTTAVPESYAVGSVGWECGEYVWFIDSAYGTVEELTGWAAQVIASADC